MKDAPEAAVQEVDWTEPSAVVFGNEKVGISDAAVAVSDGSVLIPTSGFAQSLNISVAAALVLFCIQQQRINSLGYHANMLPHEAQLLTAVMLLRDQVWCPSAPAPARRAPHACTHTSM